MGAHPYYYFVAHNADVKVALEALRQREFKAGRYHPAIRRLRFPLDAKSPSPGPRHPSIEKAREAAQEEGTRSILDLDRIAATPDFCAASPLPGRDLSRLFGTDQPTRTQVEAKMDELLDQIPRGEGIYLVTYKDGAPDEIFFAGYSFD